MANDEEEIERNPESVAKADDFAEGVTKELREEVDDRLAEGVDFTDGEFEREFFVVEEAVAKELAEIEGLQEEEELTETENESIAEKEGLEEEEGLVEA